MSGSSEAMRLLVRKLESHWELTASEREAIFQLPFTQRSVSAQSYLVREGDAPMRCAVLVSGYAFRHKLTGDGMRQILALHIAGEAVDFQNIFLDQTDHNVQMLTRGEVAEIPRSAIHALIAAHPGIGRAVLVTTLVESATFREWVLNVGRRDSRTRIAHLLCEFAVRLTAQGLEPDGVFELPMTQEQLADATGLTPVHVNRVLKGLEADGLIERDRRSIRFPDWLRMRDVGDFDPRYLHFRSDRAQQFA